MITKSQTINKIADTEEILRIHAQKYPKMQPTDAVKLLYQNEFGGGHLVSNPQKSLEFILAEYGRTPQRKDLPLAEKIGNGILRVSLSALDGYGLSCQTLNDIFVKSSALVAGNISSFKEKLEILKALTEEGVFAFSAQELSEYLCAYERAGFPAVSHSELYRQAYSPAYRIVLEDELKKILEK